MDEADSAPRTLAVAVTGGAGSGKSLVCDRLRSLGAAVASADAMARDAVRPGSRGLAAVVRRFGRRVLEPGGGLDRRRLRREILADPAARRDLEGIVHPEVAAAVDRFVQEARARGEALAVVEIPLLFEAGFAARFDVVVAVTAPRESRIARLAGRDGVSRKDAEALMDVQMPEDEKARRARFTIRNDGPPESTLEAADDLYEKLMDLARRGPETP